MRWSPVLIISVLFSSGCITVKIGDTEEASVVDITGVADGYVSLNGVRPYDGTIAEFSILSWSERPGELLALEIWPVAGLGVGLLGARAQLLFLDVGLGALIYKPNAPPHQSPEDGEAEDTPPPSEAEETPASSSEEKLEEETAPTPESSGQEPPP